MGRVSRRIGSRGSVTMLANARPYETAPGRGCGLRAARGMPRDRKLYYRGPREYLAILGQTDEESQTAMWAAPGGPRAAPVSEWGELLASPNQLLPWRRRYLESEDVSRRESSCCTE